MSVPAFPLVIPNDFQEIQEGMTLRDYFAAAALPALIATSDLPRDPMSIPDAVDDAYRYADAMLKRRQS